MNINEFINSLHRDFDVNTDLGDVKFKKCSIQPYKPTDEEPQRFGEKNSLLYETDFTLFNVNYSIKFLCFIYEEHGEVLKLDIQIQNEYLEKEALSCRNYLQRKRNLNLTFLTLIKFTRLFESRRLICQTVCQKQRGVTISTDETGMSIKFSSSDLKDKYLEIYWSIIWNLDDVDVRDLFKFYCNYKTLDQNCWKMVKEILEALTVPNINFHLKLKLWKSLMSELYKQDCSTIASKQTSADVLEISDSDSDDSVLITSDCLNVDCDEIKDDVLVID